MVSFWYRGRVDANLNIWSLIHVIHRHKESEYHGLDIYLEVREAISQI